MTDEREPLPPGALDRLALVFRVVDAANEYGFSIAAAANAAVEQLADASDADAVMVAALLAALVAIDLRPRGAEDLERWSQQYGFALHCREREL